MTRILRGTCANTRATLRTLQCVVSTLGQMSAIKLRPLALTDLDHIMTWVNEPAVVGNIAAFEGAAITRDQELAWISRTLASSSDVVFSIVSAADNRYLGQIGLHQIYTRAKVARLGLVIASRRDMGRGVGSAAVAAILEHAFATLKLHKVWLMIFADNQRSAGIYQRAGFVVEGVLREEYFHQGRWHDMLRMSMLQHEWRARIDAQARVS